MGLLVEVLHVLQVGGLQVSQLAHVGQAFISPPTLTGMLQHLSLLAVFEDFVCQGVGDQQATK